MFNIITLLFWIQQKELIGLCRCAFSVCMLQLHRFSHDKTHNAQSFVLLDFSLTVKKATLIFISGRGSAISSAKEGKSGFIYNVVKS